MSLETHFIDTLVEHVDGIDICGIPDLCPERFRSPIQDVKIPAIGKLPVSLLAGQFLSDAGIAH